MLIFDQLKKSDPRLRLVAMSVLAGLLTLLAGLWYHQVMSARHYAESLKTQSFRTIRVPAIRGKILDRNGAPLAENRPDYKVSLFLDLLRPMFADEFDRQKVPVLAAKQANATPNRSGLFSGLFSFFGRKQSAPRLSVAERDGLNRYVRYLVVSNAMARVGAQLGLSLSMTEEAFHDHYLKSRALPLPIVGGMNPQQVALFQEQAASAPGLLLDVQPTRVYVHGPATAHLVGFMQRDESSATDEEADFDFRLPDYRGLVGIEGAFDRQLRGRAGTRALMVNSLGYRQTDEIWSAPEPGKNVVLTIDLAIQTNAWRALRTLGPHGTNTRGAVVVLDASNGDVLAMVSSPTFDPNVFIPKVTRAEWLRLNDSELMHMANRATMVTRYIAPGSIFKIIVGIAALEQGLNPNENFRVLPHPYLAGKGAIRVGKRLIDDQAPPGDYDFKRAFIKSSNAYFVHHGTNIGIDSIRRVARQLHLGEETRLPLLQEDPGIFPTRDWVLENRGGDWSAGDTANICIGQGDIAVTPIQMAIMTAAVANRGKVLWPRLVDRLEAQDAVGADGVQRFPAGRVRDELNVSPRTLELVREAMFADVEDVAGTGRSSFVQGMKIGGKTGTAQITKGSQVVDHVAWFASFCEFKDRLYSVVVMIESGTSGGGTSAPIARSIYETIKNRDQPTVRPPVRLAGGMR